MRVLFLIILTSLLPPFLVAEDVQKDWTIYRGSRGLTGVAKGSLPEQPALLWSFETGEDIASSPVTDGQTVYIGSGDGGLYAIGFHDGRQRWAVKRGDRVDTPPLLLDGIVYAADLSGTLFAVKAADGTPLWEFKSEAKITGSPNWTHAADGKGKLILITGYDNQLHALEAKTGTEVWQYETGNFINGAAAVDGPHAVFGGCDAQLHVVDLTAGTGLTTVDGGSYIAGSAALQGRNAWFGTHGGSFLSVNIAKGKEGVLWEYEGKESGGAFFSTPAVTKGEVIVGCRDRVLYCFRRSDGEVLWTFQSKGEIDSSPVVCGNRVVAATKAGRLILINRSTGAKVWSYEIGEAIVSSPAVCRGVILIGCDDGSLYAFGKK
ncbi:MAG: outer membrane protein assembly factor BamB family protein [Planctomycetota bacterium]|jgi:outer membrane protein assembly factor BamB